MLRRVLIVLALAAALIAATHLSLLGWSEPRLDRLEARWRSELFGGLPATEAFPARGKSPSAEEVERRSAGLGISFDRETGKAAEPEERSIPELATLARAASDEVPPLAELARERLDAAGEALDELTGALVGAAPPQWPLDLSQGAPPPLHYRAHLATHELLVLAAWQALTEDDHRRAERRLDAAWSLRQGLRGDPLLIAAHVDRAELRRELAVLRKLCPTTVDWPARLAAVDQPRAYATALRMDAWAIVTSIGRSEEFAEAIAPVSLLGRSAARAAIVHYAEAADAAALDLEEASWSRFRGGEFFAARRETIPRWNVFSRVAFSDLYGGWFQAGRTQLSVELTRQILRRRGGAPPAGEPVEMTIATLDDDLVWRIVAVADRVTFALEPASPPTGGRGFVHPDETGEIDPKPSDQLALPTHYELSLATCRGVDDSR